MTYFTILLYYIRTYRRSGTVLPQVSGFPKDKPVSFTKKMPKRVGVYNAPPLVQTSQGASQPSAKMARSTRISKVKNNLVNKSIVNLGLGFPKKVQMTHKYRERLVFTTGAGTPSYYYFSCNGMYDPNITGTGHQPIYFDQMTVLYDHYTVIGSKVTLRISQATAAGVSATIALFINDETGLTAASIQAISEQSSGTIRTIPQASSIETLLSKKWSAKQTFGGSVLGNDLLQGNSSSNPQEQSYFTFGVQANDLSSVAVLNIDVEVEYIAIWDELADINSS